jgi:hypothetical protein
MLVISVNFYDCLVKRVCDVRVVLDDCNAVGACGAIEALYCRFKAVMSSMAMMFMFMMSL